MKLDRYELHRDRNVIVFLVYREYHIVMGRFFHPDGKAAMTWTVDEEVFKDLHGFTKARAREVWWTLVEQGWVRVRKEEG
jgi:hypothetical protein